MPTILLLCCVCVCLCEFVVGLFACRLSCFWRRCWLTIDLPVPTCHMLQPPKPAPPAAPIQWQLFCALQTQVSRVLLPRRHLLGDTKDFKPGPNWE